MKRLSFWPQWALVALFLFLTACDSRTTAVPATATAAATPVAAQPATATATVTETTVPPTATSAPASTPTASPAATQPPANLTFNQFRALLTDSYTAVFNATSSLNSLAGTPQFDDESWVAAVSAEAATIADSYAALAGVTAVPNGMRNRFRLLTDSVNACLTAANDLALAAGDEDVALLASARIDIGSCLDPQLSNLGSPGGNGNQGNNSQTNEEIPTPIELKGCQGETIGQTPLTDLGNMLYQGFAGGLYPDGQNERPAAHETAGFALAQSIQPLNTDGEPDDNGKIVLATAGMSNTKQEFAEFITLAESDSSLNPSLVLLNTAQSGRAAQAFANPNDSYWNNFMKRLQQNGLTPAQVQVIWVKQARAFPSGSFPDSAERLLADLRSGVQTLHDIFPNLKLLYISSRIYAGYALADLSPEPYAYEGGFAVKWLIEAQLNGDPALNYDPALGETNAPWLAWGPYLWADGLNARSDGLIWECSDLGGDGVHPSADGRLKVAQLLLDFFKTDSTTRSWFLANP